MTDRLPWRRGEQPNHFVARMPKGLAEVWWRPTGTEGPEGWRYKVSCGETIESYPANNKQHAADQATALWPNVVRKEQARVAKIDAQRALEEQIESASIAGVVDVMAFGLGSSTYDRLIKINEILRHKKMLEGPLRPLAEAVSGELYRRRTGPG